MNRLRAHVSDLRAQKTAIRLQSAIVRDHRDDIIELIADDGATLSEVASAVRAFGEPVLNHGFKAEVLKQIGTVKGIRAGRAKTSTTRSVAHGPAGPREPETSSVATLASHSNAADNPMRDDDEDHFAARRPRS